VVQDAQGRSGVRPGGRHGARLTWAVGASGGTTHISEAENGLGCACICPICRGPLIARQGKVREHHFAHASGDECEHALETALHLAAKDILAARKEIVLPAVHLPSRFSPYEMWRTEIAPQQRYCIESVAVERRLGSIIPDLIVGIGTRQLLVEVTVTHGTDREKLRKIRDLGLSCVEIDLSRIERDILRDELENIVVDDTKQKRWLHNERSEEMGRRRLSEAVLLPSRYGWRPKGYHFGQRVYGCPVAKRRTARGKPYAFVAYDCDSCEHCLTASLEVGVFCDGFRALGKPIPPQTDFHRPPPELFGDPEEEDPMEAVGRWVDEQTRITGVR